MTVDSVDKFSLSALYSEADKILQEGVNSIINDNSIGTGGSIWGSFIRHHFCNSLFISFIYLFLRQKAKKANANAQNQKRENSLNKFQQTVVVGWNFDLGLSCTIWEIMCFQLKRNIILHL